MNKRPDSMLGALCVYLVSALLVVALAYMGYKALTRNDYPMPTDYTTGGVP